MSQADTAPACSSATILYRQTQHGDLADDLTNALQDNGYLVHRDSFYQDADRPHRGPASPEVTLSPEDDHRRRYEGPEQVEALLEALEADDPLPDGRRP